MNTESCLTDESLEISVIMSVYNGEDHLEDAIISILNQTYQEFEFIIVDDGSTDGTAEILKKFRNPKITVLTNDRNMGLTKSLNIAIRHAKGLIIARMDADDISLPHRFKTQIEFLNNNPEYAMVGSSYYQINDDGEIISLVRVITDYSIIKRELKRQNWFGHGTVMIARQALLEVGGYDERFKYAQDYDLWVRISEKHKIANIEEPLYCWRVTNLGISHEKKFEQALYARIAVLDTVEKEKHLKERMENMFPLVSVIIPTYNRPEMLAEAIKSVLNQTYQNYEIIVVNDDGVNVENIVSGLNASRKIFYIKHSKNRGLAAARNTGIRNAHGKYVAYLDDDDIYYPNHLETLVNYLETEDCSVAYTDAYRACQKWQDNTYIITEKDLPYSVHFDCDRILEENYIPVLCVMHAKECINKAGMFDERLLRMEDWDLWIRMSRIYKFDHVQEVTCEFRWRDDGTSMMTGEQIEFFWAEINMFYKYADFVKDKPKIKEIHGRTVTNALKILKEAAEESLTLVEEYLPMFFRFNYIEETVTILTSLREWYPDYCYDIDRIIDLLNKKMISVATKDQAVFSENVKRTIDNEVSEFETYGAGKEYIEALQKKIRELIVKVHYFERKMDSMNNSHGWRLLGKYYTIRDFILVNIFKKGIKRK